MTKVSYMYYIDNIPQQMIAKQLNLSKSKVSRLLQESRDKGIVKIKVNTEPSRNYELERLIKEIYGISDAVIVPNYSTKKESITRSLGKAGADYLTSNVKEGMSIGFGSGKTLSEVASHLTSPEKVNCEVIPLVGGIGAVTSEVHANDICRRVAEKLGGNSHQLYSPAIVSKKLLKQEIMADPMIQNIFTKMKDTDIKMVGAGHVTDSTFVDIESVKIEESIEMEKAGVVGDISSWFINRNGELVDLEINDRVVGHNLFDTHYKSRSVNVLVAGTWIKRDVIAAILRGKLVDVLITDEEVARYLIDIA
ncbi:MULTISPECIES: sugar-binding transcriptional regulator [unclassified Oceanobacillus]|uniref:sugar-binding transcriptional regulator n=1 Tax=unclassified Oceanobacillus TaxID=2630292 RepID=UPI00300DC836